MGSFPKRSEASRKQDKLIHGDCITAGASHLLLSQTSNQHGHNLNWFVKIGNTNCEDSEALLLAFDGPRLVSRSGNAENRPSEQKSCG